MNRATPKVVLTNSSSLTITNATDNAWEGPTSAMRVVNYSFPLRKFLRLRSTDNGQPAIWIGDIRKLSTP